MRCASLTVKADMFGKTLIPFGRDIREDTVREYMKCSDRIATHSLYHLLDNNDGTFTILDGQHRLAALCRVAEQEEMKFNITHVCIYNTNEFKTAKDIGDFIIEINRQRRQSCSDKLAAKRHGSEALRRLAMNPNIGFSNSRYTLNIARLMSVQHLVSGILNNNGVPPTKAFLGTEERLNVVEHLTDEDINELIEFANWWNQISSYACKHLANMSFRSEVCMCGAYAIWKHNNKNHPALQPEKIISKMQMFNQLPTFKHYTSSVNSNVQDIICLLLKLINYKNKTNLVQFFNSAQN